MEHDVTGACAGKNNTEDLGNALLAGFTKYLDRAAAKNKAGEDYEYELTVLNLLFIPAGWAIADVHPDGSLETVKVPPEKEAAALKGMLGVWLELTPTDKLPKA